MLDSMLPLYAQLRFWKLSCQQAMIALQMVRLLGRFALGAPAQGACVREHFISLLIFKRDRLCCPTYLNLTNKHMWMICSGKVWPG